MAESTKQARPSIGVIQLKGEFNLENRKLVEIYWIKHLEKNPFVIAFDCRELRHIDSSAIGTLVQFLQTAMNRDVKMVLCDLNESIYEIFKIACLNKFFTITSMDNVMQECGAKGSVTSPA
jgi:anti-anti-sigma factor